MNIGLLGASGKVGKILIKLIGENENINLSAVFINQNKIDVNEAIIQTNDMKLFLKSCDLVIDFSLPKGTQMLLKTIINENMKTSLVIATTGLNEHQQNLIVEASKITKVLYASNMSLGVAVLNKISHIASKVLRDFDIEISEQHHRYKKDAPSGTALTLANTVSNARDLNLENVLIEGRSGEIGARSKDEIGVMSFRGGDIVGRHTVGFYNDGEFIELNHTATSRDTFAYGAIKVALWLEKQEIGHIYSINDALGL
jgi:4-hydroxy-tetrahydrodipicolinate reductase